ncbi:VOC family protein [Ferrimicrobium acidiphilum]|uniref:VOC family protein n=1 Tax=Ferrimicrobium acidiphilum TaxID=121039 RepID=UPI001364E1FE
MDNSRFIAKLWLGTLEPKQAKNRVHLDVVPANSRHDEEIGRIHGLGARLVDDHRDAGGDGWVVMSDPEGNEFCVTSSGDDHSASVNTGGVLGVGQ